MVLDFWGVTGELFPKLDWKKDTWGVAGELFPKFDSINDPITFLVSLDQISFSGWVSRLFYLLMRVTLNKIE